MVREVLTGNMNPFSVLEGFMLASEPSGSNVARLCPRVAVREKKEGLELLAILGFMVIIGLG